MGIKVQVFKMAVFEIDNIREVNVVGEDSFEQFVKEESDNIAKDTICKEISYFTKCAFHLEKGGSIFLLKY